MVMKCHSDQPQCLFQFRCHIDVGAGRLGLATRMIMNKNHRLGMMLQRHIDHFAYIDWRLVNRALLQRFLGNQPLAVIKTQHHEMLYWFMCQPRDAVMLNSSPACQNLPVADC